MQPQWAEKQRADKQNQGIEKGFILCNKNSLGKYLCKSFFWICQNSGNNHPSLLTFLTIWMYDFFPGSEAESKQLMSFDCA